MYFSPQNNGSTPFGSVATVIALALGLLATTTQGAIINYSGLTPLTPHFQSDGTTPIPADSSFTFELGAFEPGFVPTAGNTDDWLANWSPVTDAGGAPAAGSSTPFTTYTTVFGPTDGFADSVDLTHNNSPFQVGAQGYIWGYNHQGAADGDCQWILMTNSSDWLYPDTSAAITPTATWTVGNAAAAETVVGSISGSSMTLGRIEHPIPESSTFALLAMGFGMVTLRRRRA